MRVSCATRKGKNDYKKYFYSFLETRTRLRLIPTDVLLVSQIWSPTTIFFFSSWTLLCVCLFFWWWCCMDYNKFLFFFWCMKERNNGGFLVKGIKGWETVFWSNFLTQKLYNRIEVRLILFFLLFLEVFNNDLFAFCNCIFKHFYSIKLLRFLNIFFTQ